MPESLPEPAYKNNYEFVSACFVPLSHAWHCVAEFHISNNMANISEMLLLFKQADPQSPYDKSWKFWET